jgi:hypothetical protein
MASYPILAVPLALVVAAAASIQSGAPRAPSSLPDHSASPVAGDDLRIVNRFERLPMAFEANQGQTDASVRYLSRGPGYALFLTPTEAVLRLRGDKQHDAVLRMSVVGGDAKAPMAGEALQPGRSGYFRGRDPARWLTNTAHYGRVRQAGVYPGIDLVYYGRQQQLEYDFVVAPGHDPGRIVMTFAGARTRHVDAAGNLVLATAVGDVVQQRPQVYQMRQGRRIAVAGGYRLLADNRVGFRLGAYDRGQPLVIDPVLEYSGSLGGSSNDWLRGIAIDRAGNAYLAGETESTDFPVTGTQVNKGGNDIFVSKLNPAGTALYYSNYIGGSSDDGAYAIAVDAAGSAYLTGETWSNDFPLLGAVQATNKYYGDAFVLKLGPTGALAYSSYLGGGGYDSGRGIAVNASGQAYVVGITESSNFPTRSPRQPANGGGGYADAFVTKLAANGALLFSTYHGGSVDDNGYAIALDPSGNAYITGETDSSNFPVLGAKQPARDWPPDAFVSKFRASDGALLYSTYLGGDAEDRGNGIAVDRNGSAYVVGETGSNHFPVQNARQPAPASVTSDEAFITRYTPAGNAFTFSTYLGGTGGDIAYAVGLDPAGNAYLTGHTTSSNFPVAAAIQRTPGGDGYDAFVSKISATGAVLAYSSYLGNATGREFGRAIAVDRRGHAFLGGESQDSTDSYLTDSLVLRASLPMNTAWNGDFDGNGLDDVLWRNSATGANQVWKAANSATRQVVLTIADPNWTIAGTGDFNGDGKTDLLWRNVYTGANTIWLSANSQTTQATASVSDLNWVVAGVGDFNGDGKDDILWHHLVTGAGSLWRSGSAVGAQALTSVALAWEIAGVGDFNGDAKADILWRNIEDGRNIIWRSGSSASVQAVTGVTDQSWRVAGVGDFNGDAKADILWRQAGDGRNVIWLGATASTQRAVAPVVTDWLVVGTGDYTGDHKADVLWRNSVTGTNLIWKAATSSTPQAVATVADLAWAATND